MIGYNGIEFFFKFLYLPCRNLYIRSLTLCASHRLMYHNPGMFQSKTFSLCPCNQQYSAHRGGHTCTDRRNITAYELHGIVDTQPGIYRPSGSIEINRYIFTRVGRIEIKQLCFYNIRCIIIDRSSQKDYTVHH